MKPITVNYAKSEIIISSAFGKKAFTPGTAEYAQLQAVRRDFEGFTLVTRQFKTNTTQERYKGLTYDYMKWYILTYDKENASAVLPVLEKKLDIAQAHSKGKRYPTIKAWFLESYPEFTEFGMTDEQVQEYRDSKKVVNLREGGSSAASAESADPLDKAS